MNTKTAKIRARAELIGLVLLALSLGSGIGLNLASSPQTSSQVSETSDLNY